MKLTEGSSGPSNPAPEGTHVARCFAVIDLGTQRSEYKGQLKSKRKLLLGFELPEELHTFREEDGPQPFSVWNRYTASLSEKSALRPALEGWRGRAFTPDELRGFETKNLVGQPCMLSVIHHNGYANIATIAKLPKSVVCPAAVNKPVYLSLEPGEFSDAVFDSLSERLQSTIAASPEFGALRSGKQEPSGPKHNEPQIPADEEDDIPF